MALQVDEDGAVGAPLAQRPVVHAQDARWRAADYRRPPNVAHHRISTHWHAQLRQQPRGRLAAERHPDSRLNALKPDGAARVTLQQAGHLLGERAPGAARIEAAEAPHLYA